MTKQTPAYDEFYYQHACGTAYARDPKWLGYFGAIAERIAADLKPKTVLDAGCAWGFLVEALRDRGIEAYGIDVSEFALENARPDIRPHLSIGSVLDPYPKDHYDLVVCMEVLEHLPNDQAAPAVANLARHGREVLFSSTPVDFSEATHFNVQPVDYWVEQFAHQGLYPDPEYDVTFLADWALRLRRDLDPVRVIRAYQRERWRLRQENNHIREALVEARRQLDLLSHQTAKLAELEAIKNSRTWRTAERLRALRRTVTRGS